MPACLRHTLQPLLRHSFLRSAEIFHLTLNKATPSGVQWEINNFYGCHKSIDGEGEQEDWGHLQECGVDVTPAVSPAV